MRPSGVQKSGESEPRPYNIAGWGSRNRGVAGHVDGVKPDEINNWERPESGHIYTIHTTKLFRFLA